METANKGKNTKINLLDSAIITLVSTASLFVLSFAFNCGYNNYYGIPLMFTSTNWFSIAYRIPQIGDVIFLISAVLIFFSFMINYIKLLKKPKKENETLNVHRVLSWVIIAIIIFIAIMVFLTLRFKSIIYYSVDFILIAYLVYFTIIFFKERKLRAYLTKMQTHDSTVSAQASQDVVTNGSEFFQQSEQTVKLMEAYPKKKTFLVSIGFSVISIVFMLFFAYGTITAFNQTSYCFMNDNSVVITTIDTNVIVLEVEYDASTNKYMNQYKYHVLPQENLSFYIVECGKIESTKEFDNRAWSIEKLKFN